MLPSISEDQLKENIRRLDETVLDRVPHLRDREMSKFLLGFHSLCRSACPPGRPSSLEERVCPNEAHPRVLEHPVLRLFYVFLGTDSQFPSPTHRPGTRTPLKPTSYRPSRTTLTHILRVYPHTK
jgi:hypothetical protein